jgi:glucose/arabinose dehydrogenase
LTIGKGILCGQAELLAEGFRVEASGWKGAAGSAIIAHRNTHQFYREVASWGAEQGAPTAIQPFLTGFLSPPASNEQGWTYFGRPAGIAVATDGALFFSDDANGVIYRIADTEATS